MRHWLAILTAAAACSMAPGAAAQTSPAPSAIRFENSGDPAAQAAFLRGLSLLHNFEYPRAAIAFREAQAADPDFALAYWGEAMSHNHPIWMEQDADAARAVLARLGPTREARTARVRDARERLYLDAVEILYGEGEKRARDHAYSQAMARLVERFPDDVDARAFHALSILGLAHDGRDTGLYMRAAAMLEEIYPANPDHPGVLHYLIHAYDDPTHAPLGARMARRYGAVAPDAPHAMHMTSHIFIALGLWEDVVSANRTAVASVNALRSAAGRPLARCGHYNEWLFYGLHQLSRHDEARAMLATCLSSLGSGAASANRGTDLGSATDMLVRHAIETGERIQLNGIDVDSDPVAGFRLAYADLLGARDAASARTAQARLAALASGTPEAELPAPVRRRREIILGQAEAILSLRAGQAEAGIVRLRETAERERGMPVEFGPPFVEKPSYELLGDELLRLGRREEAREAYRAALTLAPGRRLSLEGLRRAGG